jgi:hypothetical protein
MASSTITLTGDSKPFMTIVEMAEELLKTRPELFKTGTDLPDLCEECLRAESQNLSAGAGEILVTFYPSDKFLTDLAAVWTGNVDADVTENPVH